MPRSDFEKLVRDGFEALPEWVRQKISNVALLVEDEPSPQDRKDEGLGDDETLLGLYKGLPLSARGDMYGIGATLPDTITIFRLPILEAALEEVAAADAERYQQKVRDIVRETVWHEFAHHFGMDEQEVRSREAKHMP